MSRVPPLSAGDHGFPGSSGPRGDPGFKGDKGDVGLPGKPGSMDKVDMGSMKGEKGMMFFLKVETLFFLQLRLNPQTGKRRGWATGPWQVGHVDGVASPTPSAPGSPVVDTSQAGPKVSYRRQLGVRRHPVI